jgi:hypothetical protein
MIEYRKSTDFGQANALSRLISAHSAPDADVVVAALQADCDMDALISYLPVTCDKLRSITENDVLLQTVKKFIKSRSQNPPPTHRLVAT